MLFRRAPAESRARRGLYRARTAPPNDATNGLLLETSTGTIALDKVRAVATAKDAGPADLVVFEVKNYGVPQTAEILAASLNPEALILTVQNGITAQPLLAETFGKDRILPGVVRMPADVKSPGVVRDPAMLGMDELLLGTYHGSSIPRAQAIFDALLESEIGTGVSDDIWRTLWEKFIALSTFSAMTAVSRLDVGSIRGTEATQNLLRALVDETANVARASPPTIPADAADTAFEILMNLPPNIHASMLDDLLRGKRLEPKWLSDEVVRRGKLLDIPTPAHGFAYAVLAPYSDGRPEHSH
jgi:2-dehydropantoate 2-reductase